MGDELAEQMVWIRWRVSVWDVSETGRWSGIRSWQFLMADGRIPLYPERLLIPRQDGDRIKALLPKDGSVGKTRRRKENRFGHVQY